MECKTVANDKKYDKFLHSSTKEQLISYIKTLIWERDMAFAQLDEYDVQFGQKKNPNLIRRDALAAQITELAARYQEGSADSYCAYAAQVLQEVLDMIKKAE